MYNSCQNQHRRLHCAISEIVECSSNPCQHGTCTDLVDGYQCECEPGYIGTNCDCGIHSFIHSGHFYSAPSSPLLLRGVPDYSTDTVTEFHAEANRQLQVKELPKVPTGGKSGSRTHDPPVESYRLNQGATMSHRQIMSVDMSVLLCVRQIMSVYVYVSLCVRQIPSVYVSVCLSVRLFFRPAIYLSRWV